MMLAEWYKRLRHGRGYGVHSPLAYRMVREVLCPSGAYGYYVYDSLPVLVKRCRPTLAVHDLTLIYRLLHHLRPASVTIISRNSAQILRRLAKVAVPSAKITPSGGEMLICEDFPGADGCEALSGFKTAFFADSSNPVVAQVWNRVERGHLYRNPARAIVLVSDAVARQEFDIRF